jgi:hypothetical protein
MTPRPIRSADRNWALFAMAALALTAGLAGCKINVQKSANGQDKNVQVETPFGGVNVATNHLTAADVGLPVYPGAKIAQDNQNDKSADVHVGFGKWQMRVRVVNYSTTDGQEKVVAFYKKALGRYGDVIACQDDSPVGTPTVTSEGLTCSNKGQPVIQVNGDSASYGTSSGRSGFALEAGSKQHQHIVAFKSSAPGQTLFTLIEVELPSDMAGGSGKSD